MEKKPWVARTRPAPPQVLQVVGLVPGLAPEPSQVSQVMRGGDGDLDLGAGVGLLEGDLQVVAQVLAAGRTALLAAAAAAEHVAEDVAEHLVEDVVHVVEAGRRRRRRRPPFTPAWPKRS